MERFLAVRVEALGVWRVFDRQVDYYVGRDHVVYATAADQAAYLNCSLSR